MAKKACSAKVCGGCKDFWSPREIVFCREQIIWILSLEMIKMGEWPPNPLGSGYTDAPIGKSGRHRGAYFEAPIQIVGEINARLRKTRVDGKLLLAEIKLGTIYIEDFSEEAHMALNYISGWVRRDKKYSQFKAEKRYKGAK